MSGAGLGFGADVFGERSGESNAAGVEIGSGAGDVGSEVELRSSRLGETATRGSTSLNAGEAALGPKRLATSVGGGGARSASMVGLRAGVSELCGEVNGLFSWRAVLGGETG